MFTLALIFAGPILIGGLAGFPLEEQRLNDSLVGVDSTVGAAGVAELKG
jgi:hypothetical protein